MINVFEPNVTQSDIEAVKKVLESNWLGKGSETERFETTFAGFIGCSSDQLLSVNSCTQAAFILAEFLALERDIIILPSMSFVGVANAFLSHGFEIHFVDVSSSTLNVEIQQVEELVLKFGSRAVLVLNHFMSGSESLSEIALLCSSSGTILIEDAAGVLGAVKNGKSLGTFGDFGIWSFDAMKTITCGDGGMIYSKDPDLVIDLKRRAYLGLITESGYKNSSNPSQNKWWEFQISGPYSRSIMNDVSSSLGLSQLTRINETLDKRATIATQYVKGFQLEKLNILPSGAATLEKTANYIFPVLIEGRRDELASFLKQHQIYTTFRYFPLHEVGYFRDVDRSKFPATQFIQESLLLLPIHPKVTSKDVSKIINHVRDFLND